MWMTATFGRFTHLEILVRISAYELEQSLGVFLFLSAKRQQAVSEIVSGTSNVTWGSALGTLLFLTYTFDAFHAKGLRSLSLKTNVVIELLPSGMNNAILNGKQDTMNPQASAALARWNFRPATAAVCNFDVTLPQLYDYQKL